MENAIVFNKTGYDPFITFLKGYAILCVVLAHSVPNIENSGYEFWGSMQVPLFLLIQTFHVFKKDTANFRIKKLWPRIILPFFILQVILFAIKLTLSGFDSQMIDNQIFIGGVWSWIILFLGVPSVRNLVAATPPYSKELVEKKTVNSLSDMRCRF